MYLITEHTFCDLHPFELGLTSSFFLEDKKILSKGSGRVGTLAPSCSGTHTRLPTEQIDLTCQNSQKG